MINQASTEAFKPRLPLVLVRQSVSVTPFHAVLRNGLE
jgi:hypothetical protein